MRAKTQTNSRHILNGLNLLRKRELSFKWGIGYHDKLAKKFISTLENTASRLDADHGGVFNLEFSFDGNILASACEKKSILLYDACNQRLISTIPKAHLDCVNCIKFLDDYQFASGSDDNTVKTWDMRYLKYPTRILNGHSNWVKNIEYSSKDNRLLTSGFDGMIYSWDLRNFTEQGVTFEKVFVMDGLMRMKITPDCSKMILCTTNGFMLLIDNINLETVDRDLKYFKPNIYRLMQESEQGIPIAAALNDLFSPHRKTNRVEIISDFPNTAEVISSLQIHPMGWCCLSRNISSDELSEWTSVHDIQLRNVEEYRDAYSFVEIHPRFRNRSAEDIMNESIGLRRMMGQNRRSSGSGIRASRTSISVLSTGILHPDTIPSVPNDSTSAQTVPTPENVNQNEDEDHTSKIMDNLSRLTHYREESNTGKGFIKELGFSSDGRIICSPYKTGVRLFGFNEHCNELSVCVSELPQKLHQLMELKNCHKEIVVSCKFHPRHWLLVTGCLEGKIAWYNPVF